MLELSNLSDKDAARLSEAIQSYEIITGEVIETADLAADASLAQTITSMMADIYRRDMRAKLFGWHTDGSC